MDGNTLDPTLQLALAGMRVLGVNGLVAGQDVAVSRTQMREMTQGFAGPQIHVGVRELKRRRPALLTAEYCTFASIETTSKSALGSVRLQ